MKIYEAFPGSSSALLFMMKTTPKKELVEEWDIRSQLQWSCKGKKIMYC